MAKNKSSTAIKSTFGFCLFPAFATMEAEIPTTLENKVLNMVYWGHYSDIDVYVDDMNLIDSERTFKLAIDWGEIMRPRFKKQVRHFC
jgi:hypothetical protein